MPSSNDPAYSYSDVDGRDKPGHDRFRWYGSKSRQIQSHRRRDRALGGGDRHGGACPGHLQRQAVLRRLDRVRRRAEQPCQPGRCRHARHAAGHQRGMHRAGHPHWARTQGQDQSQLDLRPEELFLSRPAAGLSDQPVQEPDRRRGRGHRRSARAASASRSASSGCISSRTRARACTTSIRNIPMSISTAPAWR